MSNNYRYISEYEPSSGNLQRCVKARPVASDDLEFELIYDDGRKETVAVKDNRPCRSDDAQYVYELTFRNGKTKLYEAYLAK